MSTIADIPEIQALDARRHLIRIPSELDIPITPRVRRIIDTAEFRRLSQVSQLGLVSLVYPAAHHTRFEHSLGVYRLALLYLKQLIHDERFVQTVKPADAEVLIVAALLHDVGHWPFCHPIEDIRLPNVPHHEAFACEYIANGEIADVLREDWQMDPQDVLNLLAKKTRTPSDEILNSILSGPIDIDKMDYLVRDSLHAGVPYGRNFDQQRLIGSLCLNEAGNGIAITEKGRTAAEMMVFARYVMFSEVYWHHAVRSATAMLQRAFYLTHQDLAFDVLFRLPEREMVEQLQNATSDTATNELLSGLFGPKRKLYKRLAQYSLFQQGELYERLSRKPYGWLVARSTEFARQLGEQIGETIHPSEVLFDAPPQQREIEFNIDISFPKEKVFRPLSEISPVVQTLALKQFDDYVKRVRIFVHPKWIDAAKSVSNVAEILARFE